MLRRIGDGEMMCKPLAHSSGEWVLPISRWCQHDESAQFIVSTDAGRTWTRRGGCDVPKDVRQVDEHITGVVRRIDPHAGRADQVEVEEGGGQTGVSPQIARRLQKRSRKPLGPCAETAITPDPRHHEQ